MWCVSGESRSRHNPRQHHRLEPIQKTTEFSLIFVLGDRACATLDLADSNPLIHNSVQPLVGLRLGLGEL